MFKSRMRPMPILLSALLLSSLGGCGAAQPPAIILATEAVSVMVFGRGVVDLAISAYTGRDCSIVRLDRRQTYCVPADDPAPETFCTRSLGVADCWASRSLLPTAVTSLGDTPAPTPLQQRYRAARWPKSLTAD